MHLTSQNLDTPLRQGNQGSGIQSLLGVDDCDSKWWPGGDWGVCIFWVHVPCTHHNPPLRQGDQGPCIRKLLGVDDCNSQWWAHGDWGVCILWMHVPCKHRDTPLHQGDHGLWPHMPLAGSLKVLRAPKRRGGIWRASQTKIYNLETDEFVSNPPVSKMNLAGVISQPNFRRERLELI